MNSTIHDSSGRRIVLSSRIASGGEGSVFAVQSDNQILAKLYHRPLNAEATEKLRAMTSLRNAALQRVAAWPITTLHETPNGQPCGFLMSRANGREFHELSGPGSRRIRFPNANWLFLIHVAMNCATAVENIHQNGHVIGDVNERGFFVCDQGMVRLVDCDSFQIQHNGRRFRCVMGVPLFTPPELQNSNLATIDRTANHDCFGLAILIFQLLFLGRHPFAGRFAGTGDMPIERAIAENRFAFSRRATAFQMSPPPHSLTLDGVPKGIADMFERAFSGNSVRPTAGEWRLAMERLKQSLIKCTSDADHLLSKEVRVCPWCELESKGVFPAFPSQHLSFEFDAGFDLAGIWRQIATASRVPSPTDLRIKSNLQGFVGEGLVVDVQFKRMGQRKSQPAPPILKETALPLVPDYEPGHYILDSEFQDQLLPVLPPFESVERDYPEFHEDEVPSIPTFVPTVVGSDPMLVLSPEPKLPPCNLFDHEQDAWQQYKKSLNFHNYKVAKYSTISLLFILPFTLFYWPAAILVMVFLICCFLGAAIEAWPHRKIYKHARNLATKKMKAEIDQYEKRCAKINTEIRKIREDNERLTIVWRRQINHLNALRAELPSVNEKKLQDWNAEALRISKIRGEIEGRNLARRTERAEMIRRDREARFAGWESERERISEEIASVKARNAERRQLWDEIVRKREATRVTAWENEVRRVQSLREQILEQNAAARGCWNRLLVEYGIQRAEAESHNVKIDEIRRAFDLERDRREEAKAATLRQLELLMENWSTKSNELHIVWAHRYHHLYSVKLEYEKLKSSFEAERTPLVENAHQIQLDDFLRQHLVSDAQIKGVGRKRKSTLKAWQVETAFDVTEYSVSQLQGQGFGVRFQECLLAWKDSIVGSFQFNSKKTVLPPALRPLHLRFHAKRISLQRELRSGSATLSEITKPAQAQLQQFQIEADRLTRLHAQACADWNIISDYVN